jgi:hypothetical protein
VTALKPLIYNRKNIYNFINIRIFFEKFKVVYDFFDILWRYRCDAERLATAENEVDEEDGDRETF